MDFDLIDNQLLRQQMIDMTSEQWNYNWLILNEQNGLRSQTNSLKDMSFWQVCHLQLK